LWLRGAQSERDIFGGSGEQSPQPDHKLHR
jgi:hypothetical protein